MFLGANNLIFENAKELRKNLTNAELILWEYLKQKPFGCKFRRQHPLGNYIADFYCHKVKLVIEIDGDVHDNLDVKRQDEVKEKDLKEAGLSVVRFRNEVVIREIESIIREYKPL